MTNSSDPPAARAPYNLQSVPPHGGAWRCALMLTLLMLTILSWLLARLVWLPMYFGLFFFLVAGLLVSAIAFRMARRDRPLASRKILRGAIIVSLLTVAITLFWEFEHFANTVGDPPHFTDARNAAVRAGRSSREVQRDASIAFKSAIRARYLPDGLLRSKYLPFGAIGYALWTVRSGELKLTVQNETETISSPHRGIIWLLRTLAEVVLLAVGLWFGFESLRSAAPTTNVLAPGEEYVEEA
jgi:hypothetical protein